MTGARFDIVTLDGDTDLLGSFWSAAIGLVEVEREDDGRWVVLADTDGVRRLGLQRGDARPGSVHLDLTCGHDDLDDEVVRLRALGAELRGPVRIEPYGSIANFADPCGYAFDLCAYHG